jgi:hypothetical protein
VTVQDDLDLLREMVSNSRGVFAVDRVRERIEQLEVATGLLREWRELSAFDIETKNLLTPRTDTFLSAQDGEQR